MRLGRLEIGPTFRALRRTRGAATLLVLEVALGVVVAAHAYALGEWTRGDGPRVSGIDAANLVVVRALHARAPATVAEGDARMNAERGALAKVAGVRAVSPVTDAPLLPHRADVLEVTGASSGTFAWRFEAEPGVTATLGETLLAGRGLAEGDLDASGPLPIVLSEGLAANLFPAGPAVGAHVRSRVLRRGAEVVGVVRAHTVFADDRDDPGSFFYVAARPPLTSESLYAVRVAPEARASIATALVASLTEGAPVLSVDPACPRNPEDENGRPSRNFARALAVVAWCVVFFGALAASSFLVAGRTKQIGIRRALGARRGDIVRYFLVENALLSLFGLVLGAGLTWAVNGVVHRFVPMAFDVNASTTLVVTTLFAIGSVGAALVPALRAARIHPSAALRRR